MKLKLKLLSCLVLSALPFASAQAEIHTMIDPSNGRTVYVDSPTGIDGCDPGLVLYKGWYVCSNKLPPPPPPTPKPQPIPPPADAVCKGTYLRPEFESCAPGYYNKVFTHDGDVYCAPTPEQVALCTTYYPPPSPTPEDPTSGPGWQGGFLGSDGQIYNDKEGTSLCSSCDRVIGHVDTGSTNPDTTSPGDGSTDGGGPIGNPGGIGGE